MCDVLDRVEARGEAKGEARGSEKTRIADIRNIMESLQVSAARAMQILKVPAEKQKRYINLL